MERKYIAREGVVFKATSAAVHSMSKRSCCTPPEKEGGKKRDELREPSKESITKPLLVKLLICLIIHIVSF